MSQGASVSIAPYPQQPAVSYAALAAPAGPRTVTGNTPVYAAPISGSGAAEEDGAGPFTRGFPDPASIEEQKSAYSRSLEVQLEEGHKSLQMQNAERKKQLKEAAEQQKQALLLHMEQQVKMQEMALDEQTNQAMMGLKKAALDQRAALEQQAAGLILEYQQRKMQEEFTATQSEMQRQYMDSHNQLQGEVAKHFSESQRMFVSEMDRQMKERNERLGEPLPVRPVAAPPAGVVPTYAPVQPCQTMGVVQAAPAFMAPQAMTSSYAALPGMAEPVTMAAMPMQVRYA